MIKRFLAAITLPFAITLASLAPVAAAPVQLAQFGACQGGVAAFLMLQSWDACLPRENNKPVIKKLTDLWLIAIPILNDVIKIAAYLAVAFVIWGGIQYVKSQGDPSSLTNARNTIRNALLGLVVCMLSVTIVTFIASRF